MSRLCQKCRASKPEDDFYQHTYNRTCKPCWAKRKIEWGSKINPETGHTNRQTSSAKTWLAYSDVHKRHRTKLRVVVLDHYSHGKMSCECCGEHEYSFLAIDHVVPVGRKPKDGVPRSGSVLYRWLIKNDFPDGFRVLCHNCNMGRQINGGICPHEEAANHAITT